MFQSGQAVCSSIQRYALDPNWVLQCYEAIKGRSYDSKIIPLLERVARYNFEQAILALGALPSRQYEANAVAVCKAVEQYSPDVARVVACLRSSADQRYANGLTALATSVARYDSTQVNEIMRIAGNLYLHPEALRVCSMVQANTLNMSNVTNCIRTIADKTLPTGMEQLPCRQLASASSTLEAAIECLKGNMVAYDFPITIRNSDLQSVIGLVQGARDRLKEGRVDQADRSLNSAASRLIRWMSRR